MCDKQILNFGRTGRRWGATLLRLGFCLSGLAFCLPQGALQGGEDIPQLEDAVSVPDNLIQLDGSGSSDRDGDRLRYSWRQIAGPQVKLLNAASAKPSFYAREPGKYAFELVVSDGRASSAPAVVNIEVDKLNHAPVAKMATKLEAHTGVAFTLDATESRDEDGDALRFFWRQISGPVMLSQALSSGGYSNRASLTLQAEKEGVYVFEVVATDGTARSTPQQCEVRVVAPNAAPVARVTAPGAKVVIRANAVKTPGPLGEADELVRPVTPEDLLDQAVKDSSNNTSLQSAYAPQQERAGSQPEAKASATGARVRASAALEGKEDSKPTASVSAKMPRASAQTAGESKNSAVATGGAKSGKQELSASTSGNSTAEVGERVTIRAYGVSPEGKRLNYKWRQTAGIPLSNDILNRSKDLEFIPATEGTYIFELTVSDGQRASEPAVVWVKVAGVRENVMGLAAEAGKNSENYNEVDMPGIQSVPAAEGGKSGGLFSRVLKKIK